MKEKIAQRKSLEKKLKESGTSYGLSSDKFFLSSVKVGEELSAFVTSVKILKKRNCYRKLHDYIYGDSTDRVFILYGLKKNRKDNFNSLVDFLNVRRSTVADSICAN